MEKISGQDISGLVLAGGMARRMGGKDKGLLEFRESTMAGHIAGQLQSQLSGSENSVVINANRNVSEYKKLGYLVVQDDLEDFQGPLAGMLAGLDFVATQWMIVVPCDGPFLASHFVDKMAHAIISNNHKIAVAEFNGRLQPVYVMLNCKLAQNLRGFLETGERKIDKWYGQHNYSRVDFSESSEMFKNINTPEDLELIQ